MAYFFFFIGALLAGVSVAAGAYGAHGGMLDEVQVLWVEKGARYQMYHSLALLLTSLALVHTRHFQFPLIAAGFCFIGGIVCFSGSLYAMALTTFDAGYITPLGGILFMVGWVLLAVRGPGGAR